MGRIRGDNGRERTGQGSHRHPGDPPPPLWYHAPATPEYIHINYHVRPSSHCIFTGSINLRSSVFSLSPASTPCFPVSDGARGGWLDDDFNIEGWYWYPFWVPYFWLGGGGFGNMCRKFGGR